MRHSPTMSVAMLVAFSVLAVAGCNGNSTTEPSGNPALVGSYSLLSAALPGMAELQPPVATGMMSMTDSTYTVSITVTLPGQDPLNIQDAGTYTVSGNNIAQTSTAQPGLQSTGTYTLANDTLTVDVTAQGQQTKTVWLKQ